MKIKDLKIGNVYYVADDVISKATSPKLLLLDKEDKQYLFKVCDRGVADNRKNGEVFWKELKSLELFEDCFFEYHKDCICQN